MSLQSESTDVGGDQSTAEVVVPEDFPRDPCPAALSGTQPKLAARLIDGRHVVGLTPEERAERYVGCLDLVDQLTAYVNRKLAEKPDLTMSAVWDSLATGCPVRAGTWERRNWTGRRDTSESVIHPRPPHEFKDLSAP